jgi:ubiquinone/menaquinone biosynthesis C-methylase UbiE
MRKTLGRLTHAGGMFADTAALYDAFYDALDKDYVAEARKVLKLVRPHVRKPRTLLDVACGTGRHVEVFARTLDCVGVDIHDGMLDIARRRCPSAQFVRGDMATLDLGDQRFDIVTCLFSSVAYCPTVKALRNAIARMAAHLEPHGVLVVEPWFEPGEWDVGHLAVLTVDEPGRKAARISRSSRRGDMSVLDFDYLVADHRGTRHIQERHELRLFRWDQYLHSFEAAGLTVEVDEYGLFGRGLLLGTFA